jgi:4-hydroxythreonine-4-phosphate dehydrogenase
MMLATPELRVVLATVHEPLAAAIARLDQAMERRAIRFADIGAGAFGVTAPRIAVAGLNPHAGEGGRFGREEIDIIAPAVAAARTEGFDVTGPLAADTVFMQARQGRFDVVVAQYHDQGLIPIKLGGLADGVNVTLGLPCVRTSPDHGTALDIADRFEADPASLATAIATAGYLAVQKTLDVRMNTVYNTFNNRTVAQRQR